MPHSHPKMVKTVTSKGTPTTNLDENQVRIRTHEINNILSFVKTLAGTGAPGIVVYLDPYLSWGVGVNVGFIRDIYDFGR